MPSARRPTQSDVARLAGVSKTTVSYVASGRADRGAAASPETIERVQEAMSQLNYRPQFLGRALRRQHTGVLGVVTYSPLNPWAEVVLTQIQDIALSRGMDTALLRFARPAHADRLVKLLREGIADGVIVLGFEVLSSSQQRLLAELPLPVLAFANEGPDAISYLRQHEDAAIVEAVYRLCEHGITRLGYIRDNAPGFAPKHRREVAFRQAVEATCPGIEAVPVWEIDSTEATAAAMESLLERIEPGPDIGVLCSSDRAALALLWTCWRRGITIPAKLRIIGMGNIAQGRLSHPRLTSLGIEDPDYSSAIEHLLDRIEDAAIPPAVFDHPWRLMARETG